MSTTHVPDDFIVIWRGSLDGVPHPYQTLNVNDKHGQVVLYDEKDGMHTIYRHHTFREYMDVPSDEDATRFVQEMGSVYEDTKGKILAMARAGVLFSIKVKKNSAAEPKPRPDLNQDGYQPRRPPDPDRHFKHAVALIQKYGDSDSENHDWDTPNSRETSLSQKKATFNHYWDSENHDWDTPNSRETSLSQKKATFAPDKGQSEPANTGEMPKRRRRRRKTLGPHEFEKAVHTMASTRGPEYVKNLRETYNVGPMNSANLRYVNRADTTLTSHGVLPARRVLQKVRPPQKGGAMPAIALAALAALAAFAAALVA